MQAQTNRVSAVAVIVAPPGRLRDGLSVLLRARNEIALAGEADDVSAGLKMIAKCAPTLVVVDGGDSDQAVALQELKAHSPQVRFIALVHDQNEECRVRAAGADATLLHGFTSETLSKTIEEMMTA